MEKKKYKNVVGRPYVGKIVLVNNINRKQQLLDVIKEDME